MRLTVLTHLTGSSGDGDAVGTAAEFVRVTRTAFLTGSLRRCELVRTTTVLGGETAASIVVRSSGRCYLIRATPEFGTFASAPTGKSFISTEWGQKICTTYVSSEYKGIHLFSLHSANSTESKMISEHR